MNLVFNTKNPSAVQIFFTWHIPLWTYVVLLFLVPIALHIAVNFYISRKKLKKRYVQELVLKLTVFGTFIIALALGANSGIKFGNLPSTISLFNPLIGFIPIYIAYLFEKAILDKRIK